MCVGRCVIATYFLVPPFSVSLTMKSDPGCQEQVTASKILWNIGLQIRGKGFVTWRSLVEGVTKKVSGYEFQNTEETTFSYVLLHWSTWFYSSGLRFSTPDAEKKKYWKCVWEYSSKKWVLLVLREQTGVMLCSVWKGLFEEPLCEYSGLT